MNRLSLINNRLQFKTLESYRSFKNDKRICLKSMKINWQLSTCNRLDLETLASRPIMPKCIVTAKCPTLLVQPKPFKASFSDSWGISLDTDTFTEHFLFISFLHLIHKKFSVFLSQSQSQSQVLGFPASALTDVFTHRLQSSCVSVWKTLFDVQLHIQSVM